MSRAHYKLSITDQVTFLQPISSGLLEQVAALRPITKNSQRNRRLYWWGGVVNLFGHVTAFNQSDDSIDQSNCRTVVTCQDKFTTPPHQYGRL